MLLRIQTKMNNYYDNIIYDNPYPDRAGVILLSPNKKYVLLVKSKSENTENSRWGFPKGSLEKGEHFNECAMRELKEETGISINIDNESMSNTIKNIQTHHNMYNNKIYYYVYIINNESMKIIMNTIKGHKDDNDEIDKLAFMPLDKIKNMWNKLNSDTRYILKNIDNCVQMAIYM